MADRLYEQYEELYLQQAQLFEENAVAEVRAAFGGFNRGYLEMLRSVAMTRQQALNMNANSHLSSSNQQQLARAQEEIESARDSAQRQLEIALANSFGALANLPLPSPPTVSNQLTVSGTLSQANAEQEDANGNANHSDDDSVSIKSEDSSECESDFESHSDGMEIKEEATEGDQIEMTTTSRTSGNVNPNNDNVSVKMEIKSECASSDSESSSDEEEFTSGQIKYEIVNAGAIDQLMNDSEEQLNIDTQEANTANEQADNTSDNNGEEQNDSQAMNFNVNDEAQSDAETIDEAFAQAVSNEPVQSITTLGFVSLPSTSTGRHRPRSTRAKKKVNFTVSLIEDASAGPNQDSTVNGNGKRPKRQSRKVSTPKRAHAEPEVDAAEEDDDGEVAQDEGEETGPLKIIIQYLKCPEDGCKKKCTDKAELTGHLLVKHKIKKYRCKVKGCTQSFAKKEEMTDHLKLAHRKLKNWPCDKCETTCTGYQELSTHFNNYHQTGRFDCSADRCAFTGETRLQVHNHQRKHSCVKYECTFAGCTGSFKQKSDLRRHLRTHTQERPFACEQCPKAFTTNWELTGHKRTHVGLKPYLCKWPGCDYSASSRSNVNRHVRTVHFGLPPSKKEQTARRIIDTRDVREFVEKMPTN